MLRWKGALISLAGCGRRYRRRLCFATHGNIVFQRQQAVSLQHASALRYAFTTAVTTIVIMVVAVERPIYAWEQPLLRLFDTVVGVAIGLAAKWIASYAFYKARGEPVQ